MLFAIVRFKTKFFFRVVIKKPAWKCVLKFARPISEKLINYRRVCSTVLANSTRYCSLGITVNNSKLTTAKMQKSAQEKPVPFDLLEGNVELFYVNFDILTPRPHLMILPKDEETIGQDFTAMSDEQMGDLMEASYGTLQTVMKTPFAIPGLILSLHRGAWFKKEVRDKNTGKTKAATFHAHLCVVDVNKYLQVFEANKDNLAVRSSQL